MYFFKSTTESGECNMENATLQVYRNAILRPNIKGIHIYQWRFRLADQYMREPLCIMADIYPVIGQIYDESPRKVERAIRKVVEVGWQNNREYMVEIMGFGAKKCPGNAQLLMHLCITYSTVIHSQL